VGIVTGYGLDGRGFMVRFLVGASDIFLCTEFRPALEPIQSYPMGRMGLNNQEQIGLT
jgi:hypothetical protein